MAKVKGTTGCSLQHRGTESDSMREAHAIAKAAEAFTRFPWLCRLDKMKGVDIGETYHNKDAAREFTHYIAQAERERMKERYNCGKFLTYLFGWLQ